MNLINFIPGSTHQSSRMYTVQRFYLVAGYICLCLLVINYSCRFVFLARVLVGMYEKGEKDQQQPGKQKSGEPFDTTVDNATKPNIFVVYKISRAYPEFLYIFA